VRGVVLIGFSDLNESGFYGHHSAVNLKLHQDGGSPIPWIPEILDTDSGIAEFSVSCHHEQILRLRHCSTSTQSTQ
jgi:hypothetical protein